MLQIKQVDFNAQLVDQGRQFAQHLGYCQSGAMDWVSFKLANALVGNPLEASAIEVSFGGIIFEAQSKMVIAIGYASEQTIPQVLIDNQTHQINQPLVVNQSQIIKILPNGACRFYVAIQGSIEVPEVHGSCCDVAKETLGGLHQDGSGLKSRDIIKLKPSPPNKSLTVDNCMLNSLVAWSNLTNKAIPVHFCYQHQSFSRGQKALFLSSEYEVSPQSGKQGIRLSGQNIRSNLTNMLSEGICNGAIQIAGDGLPMILLADRQTIGGYPKIGAVGGLGLARLGQAKPGDKIVFELSDNEIFRQQRLLAENMLLNIQSVNRTIHQ
ncbi:biotin-dependent carboxyltransferase family protein [Glaciecola sp. 1036]|uniref:5-oxoprolinase subunit C family protein n=1 Tax=Alteromonadaceae TaxID=72275 RepID=UPI003D04FCDB